MKKNILTIIIMALCLANMVLTSIIMFAMLPTFEKTNNLITQVSKVLDLELESGEPNTGRVKYNIDDLESIPIESKQTINLKKNPGDTESHYALLETITVKVNKKAEDYSKVKKLILDNPTDIQDIVKDLITSYSAAELNEKIIREESLKKIQDFFNTDCVISISLGGFTFS